MLEIKSTERGFQRGEFVDLYGSECSIQESSIATQSCLWLGVDKDFNNDRTSHRMHLTQEMAADLIPLLQHFVEHGSLST